LCKLSSLKFTFVYLFCYTVSVIKKKRLLTYSKCYLDCDSILVSPYVLWFSFYCTGNIEKLSIKRSVKCNLYINEISYCCLFN
uniref:Ovule protein n=1 Tax=Brugia timori TaxID=42155 RepID=A0A0R3Q4X4_9BILA